MFAIKLIHLIEEIYFFKKKVFKVKKMRGKIFMTAAWPEGKKEWWIITIYHDLVTEGKCGG